MLEVFVAGERRVGFKCRRCCVWKIVRRQDPPYVASDWFILCGAFRGWLDLGTKDWDWLSRSVNQSYSNYGREDQSLLSWKKKIVLNGEISVRNVKCGVWCENGSNCVTVTLKAWCLAALQHYVCLLLYIAIILHYCHTWSAINSLVQGFSNWVNVSLPLK